jgi:hypothetical protein
MSQSNLEELRNIIDENKIHDLKAPRKTGGGGKWQKKNCEEQDLLHKPKRA